MSTPERRGGIGGISLGGILVIVGIVVMLVWSIWRLRKGPLVLSGASTQAMRRFAEV